MSSDLPDPHRGQQHPGEDESPPESTGASPGTSGPAPRRSQSAPGRRRRPGSQRTVRLTALVVVLAALVGVGLADATVSRPSPTLAPAAASSPAPVGAQSSSWFCVGGTTAAGHLGVMLTNVSTKTLTGSMTVVGQKGAAHQAPVALPGRSVQALNPANVTPGQWLASRVELYGGGVAAAQSAQASSGWSEVPCTTTTSPSWYLPSGATAGGSQLEAALYNPTATTAVADLSFVTPSGVQQPQPYQGLVIPSGALVVKDVGKYVQNQQSVATEVTTKSGRLVAVELQRGSGPAAGLSLRLGVPRVQRHWVVPSTVNTPGGAVDLDIFNPTISNQRVTVSVRLPSGPVAPLVARVPGGTTWHLALSSQTRIPASVDYVTTVRADGGGVVVGRSVQSPSGASPPRLGAMTAIGGPGPLGGAATSWLLSPPGTSANPVVPGAKVAGIAIANPGATTVAATVENLSGPGQGFVATPGGSHLSIPPGGLRIFDPSATSPQTFKVVATGGVAVSEDLAPAGSPGVVTVPGTPTG